MSGIGEASAVLTVAGAGLSLASKLKEILDDYKDAATIIEKLRDELEATSNSLQNLGQLAEQNGLQNENAVADTRKLTERCQRTISDIKNIFRLESAPSDPSSSNRETELTRLDRVKWVLSKSKLEVPRAELGRLKLDIMLLYFTLMTLRAHTKEDQRSFQNRIPGVKRELHWANAEYERTYLRSKHVEGRSGSFGSKGDLSHRQPLGNSHKKGMEDYLQYLAKRDAERKESRLQQKLAFHQRQAEEKRKKEEQKKKEIADAAIAEYKSQVKKEEERAEQTRQQSEAQLHKMLTKVGVEEEKIGLVLKDMASSGTPPVLEAFQPPTQPPAAAEADCRPTLTATGSQTSVFSRIFRRGTSVSNEQIMLPPVLEPATPLSNHERALPKHHGLQAWVISRTSDVAFAAPISEKLLSHLLSGQQGFECEKSLLDRFALLDIFYQREINRLCFDHDLKPGFYWALIYLAEIKEGKRRRLWRHVREVARVQIVLRKEEYRSGESTVVGPRTNPTGDGPRISRDQREDTSGRVSHMSSDKPTVDAVAGRPLAFDPNAPHGRKHDDEPEVIQRTRRYYSGRESLSKGILLANIVQAIATDSNGVKYTKTVKTEISKDAIDARVVRNLGYDFVEENGKILIPIALDDSVLNTMHESSDSFIMIKEDFRDEQDFVSRVPKPPRVTWALPPSRSTDADDLYYRGRAPNKDVIPYNEGARRTLSQPGETGFVFSRPLPSEDGEFHYPSAEESPYYESPDNEVVKYDPQNLHARDFPRAYEYERRTPRQEHARFSGDSISRVPSKPASDNRSVPIFLDERTESPYDYSAGDWSRHTRSLTRSRRAGSPTSYTRQPSWSATFDDLPSSGHPRPARRGRATDRPGGEVRRTRSRERHRPSWHSHTGSFAADGDYVPVNYPPSNNAYVRDDYVRKLDMSRSRSRAVAIASAPSSIAARQMRTDVILGDDLGNSSEDQIMLERQRESKINSLYARRRNSSQSGTDTSDQENFVTIHHRNPDLGKRHVKVIAAASEDVTHLPDSEIIERQLARYRDDPSLVHAVDEMVGDETARSPRSSVSHSQASTASTEGVFEAGSHEPEASTREAEVLSGEAVRSSRGPVSHSQASTASTKHISETGANEPEASTREAEVLTGDPADTLDQSYE